MKTTIKQGTCFSPCIKLTYKKTGSPVDLTGCEAYSQMRTEPGGELVATGICNVNSGTGRITVTYNSLVTENIPVGEYGYDIWLVVGSDETQKRPIWDEKISVVGRYTDNFSPASEVENG